MNYTLSNQELTVGFSSLGGALTSIKNQDGLEYLWQGDPTYWSGQAPHLFPICGSLREDQAETLDGKKLSMPRHGIIRKLEFICEKEMDSELIFSISSTPELREQYPYDFTFYVHYRLSGKTLFVQYLVSNHSTKTMPFFVGAHPGFNCPIEAHLDFTDYKVEFEQSENLDLVTSLADSGLIDAQNKWRLDYDGQTLPLHHDLFEHDILVFEEMASRSVRLSSDKGQHGVEISYPDFPNLFIWSKGDAPFVALEPMVGMSTTLDEDDIFEHKRQVQYVEAKGLKVYSYQMTFY